MDTFLMNNITQDMKYRQSLMKYALKFGVSRASQKYNKTRSYTYFWLSRYDGSLESSPVNPADHTAIQTSIQTPNSSLSATCAAKTRHLACPSCSTGCESEDVPADLKACSALCSSIPVSGCKLT